MRTRRKLLVLFAVLAISSVASAGLIDLQISSINGETITPVSELLVSLSDWVGLDIVYDDQGDGLALIQLSTVVNVAGPGTLDLTDLTIPAGMWDLDPGISPAVGPFNDLLYSVGFQDVPPAGGWDGDIVIDHILVHCDNIGTITVTLSDRIVAGLGTINESYSSVAMGPGVTIFHVPEPMTLALLGLGGLLLRRAGIKGVRYTFSHPE